MRHFMILSATLVGIVTWPHAHAQFNGRQDAGNRPWTVQKTLDHVAIRQACTAMSLGLAEMRVHGADDRRLSSVWISDEPPLSLERVLIEIGRSRQAVAAASEIAATISEQLGRPTTAKEFAERIKDPRAVAELFSVRISDFRKGYAATQAMTDARGVAVDEETFRLPQQVLMSDAYKQFEADRWEPEHLFGKLYRYAIPSGISAHEVKSRAAVAEVFERLALNQGQSRLNQFRVVFLGRKYSEFDSFIDALVRTNHQIEMDISNEVADFLHLFARQPDGSLREVQTDVRIRTGYRTPEGAEIIVPAVHSHLIFRITGPSLNSAVEFYQGVNGTHFYPSLVTRGESWVGIRTSATYGGEEARRALSMSALTLELLRSIARMDSLFAGGYGQIGICNDTVAIIEILLNGETTVYPLLINKRRVLTHLDKMIEERSTLAAQYREIRDAVSHLPFDGLPNDSQPKRILSCIPYRPGPTPYVGFNDARQHFLPSHDGTAGPDLETRF